MKIPDKLPNSPKYRDFPELTKEEWEDFLFEICELMLRI